MKLAQRVARVKPSATLSINAKAKKLKLSGIQVVNFGVGEPDFDTPEYIQEAAIKAIRAGHTRYTAVSGIDDLKDCVASVIRRDYGLSYDRENVLISCGGKHALYNLFQATLDPGDEVIIPSPFWVSYPDMLELADAVPVIVECEEKYGFKITPAQLEKAITSKTRMFILNSPSNPTGAYYTKPELQGLAEVLVKYPQVLIASDDIYYKILFSGREWVSIAGLDERLRERTFIVNGASKTYCMTGWRIGYLVGHRDVIKAASTIQGQSTSNPNSIAQWASVAALSDGQSSVMEMVRIFETRCKYVLERLAEIPGVTCPTPAGAFYVFPNFSSWYGRKWGDLEITGSLQLTDYLLEKAHVAVVPGGAFGEDRCLRLSYALSMGDLEEGFNRISRALQQLK